MMRETDEGELEPVTSATMNSPTRYTSERPAGADRWEAVEAVVGRSLRRYTHG